MEEREKATYSGTGLLRTGWDAVLGLIVSFTRLGRPSSHANLSSDDAGGDRYQEGSAEKRLLLNNKFKFSSGMFRMERPTPTHDWVSKYQSVFAQSCVLRPLL